MAKDFGRTDYWAPESDLDGIEPGAYYPIAPGVYRKIRVNDFVDLSDPIPQDPLWGSSYQVLELNPTEIVVRGYNAELDLYEPTSVSVELVSNNYFRSPDVDEIDLPVGSVVMEG